jgi:hypothetical protein
VAVSDVAKEMYFKDTSVNHPIKTHVPAASRTRSYDEAGVDLWEGGAFSI